MAFQNAGILIPVVAIAATFSVPVVAIIMDYKRRKLVSEERRAMIEKGMEPPPLDDASYQHGFRDPERRRERALFSGLSSLMIGIGLGVAAFLLQNVVKQSFIPLQIVGPLTIGACVLSAIGIGNLIYFAVTRKKGGEGGAAP